MSTRFILTVMRPFHSPGRLTLTLTLTLSLTLTLTLTPTFQVDLDGCALRFASLAVSAGPGRQPELELCLDVCVRKFPSPTINL